MPRTVWRLFLRLLWGVCAGEGRSYHPSKTLIEHQSLQLLRAVTARGQAEKIMNSLRPGSAEGVGIKAASTHRCRN